MKIRATFLGLAKLAAATAFTGGLASCGAHGKIVVDSPAIPYQAPDISEITGIDDDSDDGDAGSASGSAAAK